ncbi:MAG: S9 family peptidase [Candidatus Didemnitutus sp.]|nr:S9 family peptidase [Candidatus Didemnitutus sp.]
MAHVLLASEGRPFRVSDIFEIEQFGRVYGGPFAFSPDGEAIAITLVRPKKDWTNHRLGFFWGNADADVWLHRRGDSEPHNTTNGLETHSGWLAPMWSPMGGALALVKIDSLGRTSFSFRNGITGAPKVVDGLGMPDTNLYERPFAWIDESRIVCAEVGEGVRLDGAIEQETQMRAPPLWAASASGKSVTVSVLDSGAPVDFSKRPQGRLAIVDLASNTVRTVATGLTTAWELSPDCRLIAYCRQAGAVRSSDSPLSLRTGEISTLEIYDLAEGRLAIDGAMPEDVVVTSLRWSPDGRYLALLGYLVSGDERPALFRIDLMTRRSTQVRLGDIDASSIPYGSVELEWCGSSQLILRGASAPGRSRVAPDDRRDWWLLDESGPVANISKDLPNVPTQLWRARGSDRFFGVAAGRLYEICPGNFTGTTVEIPDTRFVHSIAWPKRGRRGDYLSTRAGTQVSELILETEDGDALLKFDIDSGRARKLVKPTRESMLRAYRPDDGQMLFTEVSRRGTFLWRVWPEETPKLVLQRNGFLAKIEEPKTRIISYKSLKGEELNAAVILPYGYVSGRRYPTIVEVYGGKIIGEKYMPTSINSTNTLNDYIIPARGFVKMIVSVPLSPEGLPDDPWMRLPEGVLPAVDAVIADGIADPNRLILIGHSYGGYGVYGLIEQTDRFKAAIALAGVSDLVSIYGTLDARYRYADDAALATHSMQALIETGAGRMGNPPWKDSERYRRNNPINFVDRVNTPLLIQQGDVDYVALQQGEQFFMALQRQGKRSRFLRYWGEGHLISSPANVTDFYNEVVAWCDEHGDIARGEDGMPLFVGECVASRHGKSGEAKK